ncbi:MAG: hypothetical protein K2I00_00025, partial [Ruminococcus sp.]|nr:hypothetical protein [Ruminococcus sp.]
MKIQRKLSVGQRVISGALAILVIMMSYLLPLIIPLTEQSSNGVLNARAEDGNEKLPVWFIDDNSNIITEIESGKEFSLLLPDIDVTKSYRLEIIGDDLAFSGDNLKSDEDTYSYSNENGTIRFNSTLTIDNVNKKRYLDFSFSAINGELNGGDTFPVTLGAYFKDGLPDSTECKFKLIDKSTGENSENTITTSKPGIYWTQDKMQDKDWLPGNDLKKGATVEYTLTAKPDNSHKTGRWFADGLHFVDNMTIPDSIEAEYDLESAIRDAGFEKFSEPTITSENNGTEIKIEFWVYSNDETKEMDAVNIILPVTFRFKEDVTLPITDVPIVNTLQVSARGAGSEVEKDIIRDGAKEGDENAYKSTVSLLVTPPDKPAPHITVKKTIDKAYKNIGEEQSTITIKDQKIAYEDMTASGEQTKTAELEYTITLTNDGDAPCNVTLTEKPDSAIEINSANKIGDINDIYDKTNKTIPVPVKAGEKVEIIIKATLRADGAGRFTNLVEYEYTWNNDKKTGSASSRIEVTKKPADISATKTGWVEKFDNNGNKITEEDGKTSKKYEEYTVDDEIHYLITITNDADSIGSADVIDNLPAGVDWKTAKVTGEDEPEDITGKTVYKRTFNIQSHGTITIELTGKVTELKDIIQNNVLVNDKFYTGTVLRKSFDKIDDKGIKVEKKLTGIKGKDDTEFKTPITPLYLTGDEELEYEIKIKNNSGNTIEPLYLQDDCLALDMENHIIFYEKNEDLFQEIKYEYPIEGNEFFFALNVKIDNNDTKIIYYTANLKENLQYRNSKNKLLSVLPWNNVSTYIDPPEEKDYEFDKDGIYNYVVAGGKPDIDKKNNIKWGNWGDYLSFDEAFDDCNDKRDLKLTKEYCGSTQINANDIDISNPFVATGKDIKDYKFQYQLTISGENNNYNGKRVVITDTLPDGMEMVKDSVKISGVSDGNYTITGDKEIKIRFASPTALNTKTTDDIVVTYDLKFTDEKAEEIDGMGTIQDNPLTFTNTAKVTLVESTDPKSDKDNAELKITKTSPAPGFGKSAVASFAGSDINAENLNIKSGDSTNNPNSSIIWDLVVYNGNGKTNNIAELDLDGMTIEEELPDNYNFGTFDADKLDPILSAKVYTLDENGNYMTQSDKSQAIVSGGNRKDAFNKALNELFNSGTEVENSGITAEFKDGHIELGGKLHPNQCLVVRILTTVKKNQGRQGIISNKAYLKTDTKYKQSTLSAGESIDKNIWAEAYFNIQMVHTTSEKSVSFKEDTGRSKGPKICINGELGEEVTYELRVDNKSQSTDPIHSLVIIDRLPYVGDIKVREKTERDSMFSIMMGDIKGVEIHRQNGTVETDADSLYTVEYSTDKTTVLTNSSTDWIKGQSGSMQWNSSKDGAVAFRIAFDDSITLSKDDYIVVKFTGIVPAYIEDKNEESIAWNTFAYGYQHKILGKGNVLTAEPTKVGVLVKKPEDKFTINITKNLTKESDKDKTFYFALFDDPDVTKGNRLSDIISVTIPKDGTTATVSMEDVSPSRLQAMYEDIIKKETSGETEITDTSSESAKKQLQNIYLVETDQDGKALKGYTTTYQQYDSEGNKIQKNDQKEIAIDTEDKEKSDVNITVTNTPNVGTITVNKTLTSENLTEDTFYFALFEKIKGEDGKEYYVRYKDAGVENVTLSSGNKDVKFDNVPVGIDFYVLECDSDGRLADNSVKSVESSVKLPDKYTSEKGINYDVTYEKNLVTLSDNKTEAEVKIKNTKLVEYSITVSKNLVLENNENWTGEFTFGLFNNEAGTGDLLQTLSVRAGESATFTGLPAGTYYVYELDKDGTTITDKTQNHKFALWDKTTGEDITNAPELYTIYDDEGKKAVTLNKDNPTASVTVTNTDISTKQIKVTKIAKNNDEPEEGHIIEVGLFTVNDKNEYKLADIDNPIQQIITDKTGKGTIIFKGDNSKNDDNEPVAIDDINDNKELKIGTRYYVFELSPVTGNSAEYNVEYNGKKYNIVNNNSTTKVGDKYYVAKYSIESVVINDSRQSSVIITDTHSNIQFIKHDVNGDLFSGAELTIQKYTGDLDSNIDNTKWDINNAKTWKTKETPIYSTSLDDGFYRITEERIPGYAKLDVTFIVENGYIKSDTGAESTATSLTVTNRSEISVSKTDTDDKDNTPIAGAEISITCTDNNVFLNKNYVELVDYEYSGSSGTIGDSNYILTGKTIQFKSKEKISTVIRGLPDGNYKLTEDKAPVGYKNMPVKEWDFKIENGEIQSIKSDSVEVTNNDILVKDEQIKVTINKENTANQSLPDAILMLTKVMTEDNNTPITGVIMENANPLEDKTDNSIKFETLGKTIAFNKLPYGDYILEEISAPAGYTKAESIKFTVDKDGIITQHYEIINEDGSTAKNDTKVEIISMVDKPIEVSVNKVDENNEELPGATLKLTKKITTDNDTTMNGVDIDIKEATLVKRDNKSITFKTNGTIVTFDKLPAGKYTLTEEIPPDGYEVANPIEFEIDKDGKIIEYPSNTIVMIDIATTTTTTTVAEDEEEKNTTTAEDEKESNTTTTVAGEEEENDTTTSVSSKTITPSPDSSTTSTKSNDTSIPDSSTTSTKPNDTPTPDSSTTSTKPNDTPTPDSSTTSTKPNDTPT